MIKRWQKAHWVRKTQFSANCRKKGFSRLFKRKSPLIQNFHTHKIDQKYFLGPGWLRHQPISTIKIGQFLDTFVFVIGALGTQMLIKKFGRVGGLFYLCLFSVVNKWITEVQRHALTKEYFKLLQTDQSIY